MVTDNFMANAIRVLAMDAVEQAKSGHPGMPMGMADIAYVLWCKVLKHYPKDANWLNRDRVILSNGHGSMLHYAALFLSGYDLSLDDLKQFRQFGSKTPGHPERDLSIGVETTTGPLGQGLANGVGIAIAEEFLANKYNKPGYNIVDHFTYVLVGDGCLMEGISHEVCSLAGTLGLGKLIVIWDDNGISIDGEVTNWCNDDTAARFKAYGWQVVDAIDGHNPIELEQALELARNNITQPTLLCCKTIIGYGSESLSGTAKVHGAPLGAVEIDNIKTNLLWPTKERFVIPDSIIANWRSAANNEDLYIDWQQLLQGYKESYPALYAEFIRVTQAKLPADFALQIYSGLEVKTELATRQCSKLVIEKLTQVLPEIIGGSADLTGSNCTNWESMQPYSAKLAGNYLYYGVREFGMFAIMNGIAIHSGLRPFGGTFLVFSDYGRNAIRLAAMMQARVVFVLSHDSIALGEDGPTHQAVEHLVSLRAIPNLQVWRPCDFAETAVAWVESIASNTTNTIVLSRQKLPQLTNIEQHKALISKGGYILFEPQSKPQALIIATGSEVKLAYLVAQQLAKINVFIRVVSMPCMEVFLAQPANWQQQVLPSNISVRFAVEAGSSLSWHQFVFDSECILSVDTFGLSAPGEIALASFGFSVDNLKQLVLNKLGVEVSA